MQTDFTKSPITRHHTDVIATCPKCYRTALLHNSSTCQTYIHVQEGEYAGAMMEATDWCNVYFDGRMERFGRQDGEVIRPQLQITIDAATQLSIEEAIAAMIFDFDYSEGERPHEETAQALAKLIFSEVIAKVRLRE